MIDTEINSKLRLKTRAVPQPTVEYRMLHLNYVPLHDLSRHVARWRSIRVDEKPSDKWTTIGVVDRFRQGRKFCVARVTDMRDNIFHLFLLDEAYKKFKETLHTGSVVGVFEPTIVWSKEENADVALRVDRPDQLLNIGDSLDMTQCAADIFPGKQCQAMVDSRAGEYCERHITRACKASRNTRMELASGNSNLDVRWAHVTTSSKGTTIYEASQKSARSRKEYTYRVTEKRRITSDGRELEGKPTKSTENEEQKKALNEFLRGRFDPGADMIRKVMGIKDETHKQNQGLSKEAMTKMGMSTRHALTKEEEEAKKRTIHELLKSSATKNKGAQKKPRYVYL